MIEWLEGYLNRGNKTLLMVTHDRFFLDRVCSVIIELDDNTLYTYRGNYSYYLEKRQERIDARRAEIARANNLYRTADEVEVKKRIYRKQDFRVSVHIQGMVVGLCDNERLLL